MFQFACTFFAVEDQNLDMFVHDGSLESPNVLEYGQIPPIQPCRVHGCEGLWAMQGKPCSTGATNAGI